MPRLNVHLVVMMFNVVLVVFEDTVDEALIGCERLEKIGGDFALEFVGLLGLVDEEVVLLNVFDRIENLLREGSVFAGLFRRFGAGRLLFVGCGGLWSGGCRD